MQKQLTIILACLLCSVTHATSRNYYLTGYGGYNKVFSLTKKDSIVPLSDKRFGGISIQWSSQRKTISSITALVHSNVNEIYKEHPEIASIWRTIHIDGTIRKPFFKLNTWNNAQLQTYIKGGLWGAFAPYYYYHKEDGLFCYYGIGPLGGIGFHMDLSPRTICDVSLNGLVSGVGELNHTWYVKVGFGMRL